MRFAYAHFKRNNLQMFFPKISFSGDYMIVNYLADFSIVDNNDIEFVGARYTSYTQNFNQVDYMLNKYDIPLVMSKIDKWIELYKERNENTIYLSKDEDFIFFRDTIPTSDEIKVNVCKIQKNIIKEIIKELERNDERDHNKYTYV